MQKRSVQNHICKRIVECSPDDPDKKKYLSPKNMRIALSIMVDYRNICAHDERMYCAKVGPKKQYSFKSLYGALSLVLGDKEVNDLADRVVDLAFGYSQDGEIINKILTDLDFGLEE